MLGLLQTLFSFLTSIFAKREQKRTVPIIIKHNIPMSDTKNNEQRIITWHPTSMYTIKPNRQITLIVLHHTGSNSIEGALSWLCNIEAKASTHYIIGRQGEIYQLVKDEDVAWHAGVSEYNGVRGVNSFSIGIELTGDTTKDPLTEEEYKSLLWLVRRLMSKYNIGKDSITDHKAVAIPPGRKVDLGDKFDLYKFKQDL